ncbi:MAG: ATP-binding protein [Sphingomicrobium sp.]
MPEPDGHSTSPTDGGAENSGSGRGVGGEPMFEFLDRLGQEAAKATTAADILAVTTSLTAAHLGVSNCAYAHMDEDQDGFTVRGNWHAPGSPSIVGHYSLRDFGTLAVSELGAGRPLIINDNLKEIAPEEAKAFQDIAIGATICMPLIKAGRLKALMAVHDRDPHYWSEYELTVIREVTERSWAHVERARAEAELRASNKRFRAAVQATRGVLWTNDAEGRMVGEQAGWAALTGQSLDEYQGHGWASAVHPDDAQATIEAWEKAVARRDTFVFEHRLKRHDGAWRLCSITAVPIIEAGEVIEWVGVHTDITDQRAAEEAVRQVNETLEHKVQERTDELKTANEALAQAQKLQALGELTGGIAHDFNNLLTVVSGSADFLLRKPDIDAKKRQQYLQAIADTAHRATALTSQLLTFGRRQSIKPEVLDIDLRIDAFAEVLARSLGSRIEVVLDLGASPHLIKADPTQIETAVLNAAVNGRDAMPEGGRLTIGTSVVEEAAGSLVRLSIADEGVGMPGHVVERAFEPFFTTKDVGKGTGLGLSQIHGFAAQAGGRAEIRSVEGRGTTIDIYLPVTDEVERVQPTPAELTPLRPGLRVLLVEDNDQVREFGEQLLVELGCEVVTANGAEQALELLRTTDIELLLSDVVMPGMSGVDLARAARAMRPQLAVLLATGYSDELLRNEPDFPILSKPYGAKTVIEGIGSALAAKADA